MFCFDNALGEIGVRLQLHPDVDLLTVRVYVDGNDMTLEALNWIYGGGYGGSQVGRWPHSSEFYLVVQDKCGTSPCNYRVTVSARFDRYRSHVRYPTSLTKDCSVNFPDAERSVTITVAPPISAPQGIVQGAGGSVVGPISGQGTVGHPLSPAHPISEVVAVAVEFSSRCDVKTFEFTVDGQSLPVASFAPQPAPKQLSHVDLSVDPAAGTPVNKTLVGRGGLATSPTSVHVHELIARADFRPGPQTEANKNDQHEHRFELRVDHDR